MLKIATDSLNESLMAAALPVTVYLHQTSLDLLSIWFVNKSACLFRTLTSFERGSKKSLLESGRVRMAVHEYRVLGNTMPGDHSSGERFFCACLLAAAILQNLSPT